MFGNKKQQPKLKEVIAITYVPKRAYEENIRRVQDGHSIVSQVEIGQHFFRQVSTTVIDEAGLLARGRDSMLLASYILYKEPGSPDYKMYKNRSFFEKGVSFHTLRDFEDLMGMRDV